jgi:hypothetical protein
MPSLLSVEMVVPDFTFRIENPTEVLQAMGEWEAEAVVQRTREGLGAEGPLPPTASGHPLNATGQLLRSVRAELRPAVGINGLPYVLVLPTGLRSEVAEVAKQRAARSRRRAARARAELLQLRREGTLGLGEAAIRARAGRAAARARELGGRARASTFTRLLRKAERAGRFGISDAEIRTRAKQAGRLGYRQARRNMDVAAILANAPKDKRAKNGRRGVFIVFRPTLEEERALQRIAVDRARFALVEKQTGIAHRGRGVADGKAR